MQKNKKALVLALTAGCAAVMLVSLIATNGSGKLSFLAEGTGTSKTLSFTSSNQPSLKDGLYYAQSRYVSIVCGDATTYSGGFIHLKAGSGYVRNVDMINELESVTVTFATTGEGKLRLGYSYHDALENDNLDIWSRETGDGGATYLTSGVTVSSGLSTCRYIYLAAETEDVDISSIEVKYGSNNCAKPAYVALPSNLNKVFNATNRLNLTLEDKDYTGVKADYDADGSAESDYVIHLDQGKPTVNYGSNSKTAHNDTNVFNDWLAANGVGDISALSRESTTTSYANGTAACGGYTGKAYRRTVNFNIEGAGTGTIIPSFVVNPYVSYDWGADTTSEVKVGDYNPFVGGELRIGDTDTDIPNMMFVLQYDVNISFSNLTIKGQEGVDMRYGWTTNSNSPEKRTFTTAENQVENDMGTDLGTIKKLAFDNCDFYVDGATAAAQAIDLKALVATKTNTYTGTDVDICRQGGTYVNNCRFHKVHDSTKQSSTIYANGINNLQVTNSSFGEAAYDGSTNTNAVDYNCIQDSGYTISGTNLIKGNTVYACNSRALRFNTAKYATDAMLTITGNTFTKGVKVSQTSNEGFGKFSATDLTNAKAGIDNFRFGNDNIFADLSGNDISSTVIANRSNTMYLVNAYVNYDVASASHIAY
jgi:hypothetical protein